ncbi:MULTISPECIES: glycosyltransferase family 4 protein [Halorussus]|uniref:glycosyltransferase family 4 protein n=1 Tax=Halorussus TaxID=1070314 RepID=UPI00209F165C|nr:glycosyltransferase family 4 protein [Halorussus vallis]USZ74876.1 glycosyltransferase family 4 protein [Halorussus vallis]
MNVGFVVYGDLRTTSGGFLYDRKLVAHLRAAGDDVTVVELPWRARTGPRALADNLDPRIAAKLRGDFDVLVEDELCHASLVGHNRRVETPVVSVVHHLRASERQSPIRGRLARAVERRYLRGVDAAVYASETTRRAAELLAGSTKRTEAGDDRRPWPSVVTRPAGDRFDPPAERVSAEPPGEGEPLEVVFVGNVVPRKGLHDLLVGLADVTGDWHLTVVGATPDAAYARRILDLIRELGVKESVTLSGRLPDAALADRLSASHLLAVPSRYEGYGIVYLEGMSFGLPALATTAGGASEIVTDGENGFLVPPGDPAAIAAAVEEVRANSERLREMRRAARRRYEAHPTWAESMASVRAFLLEIVEGKSAPEAVAR